MPGYSPSAPTSGIPRGVRAGPSTPIPPFFLPAAQPRSLFSPGVSGIPTALGPQEGWRHGWSDDIASLCYCISPVVSHLQASVGLEDPQGSAMPQCPSFYKSHTLYDVFACWLLCLYVSWSVIWGLVSSACSQDKCVLPTINVPTTIKPMCAPWVVPGLARAHCFPPFSLALPLTKHTVCLFHVPVGRCTLLPCLERVYMMCFMHSPFPTSLPRRR